MAIKGEKALAELAQQFEVHADRITTWRAQLLEGAMGVSGGGNVAESAEPAVDVKVLHAKIGELMLANDLFRQRARARWSVAERKAMIDRSHSLPVTRQAQELGIRLIRVHYLPAPVSAADLDIMRRMDELHLEYPFAGSWMLRGPQRQEGTAIGRRHAATLIKRMAIEAIYRQPNRSKPTPGRNIYPYWLRNCRSCGPVRPGQPTPVTSP